MKTARFFLFVVGSSFLFAGCAPEETETDMDRLVPKVEKGKPSISTPEEFAGGGAPAQPAKGGESK